jgi:cytochrome c-type biogenesis protein CcmE
MVEGEREFVTPVVDAESGGKGVRTRLIILGVVLALAVGYMVYAAFPGNALYFLTVNEFLSKQEYQDGRVLRVSGKLVEGSFQRQEHSTLSRFYLVDKQGPGPSGEHLLATYDGVLPDLFFNPHSEVILEGRYVPGGVFHAETILVKCPSKYRALEDEAKVNSTGT